MQAFSLWSAEAFLSAIKAAKVIQAGIVSKATLIVSIFPIAQSCVTCVQGSENVCRLGLVFNMTAAKFRRRHSIRK